MHRPIRSRVSLALPLLAATLFAAFAAGCGDDGKPGTTSAPSATSLADHRVAHAAPTPTAPGVCAPKPAKPTAVEAAEGALASNPYPVKPGSCAK